LNICDHGFIGDPTTSLCVPCEGCATCESTSISHNYFSTYYLINSFLQNLKLQELIASHVEMVLIRLIILVFQSVQIIFGQILMEILAINAYLLALCVLMAQLRIAANAKKLETMHIFYLTLLVL